jgi:hypothetical protein
MGPRGQITCFTCNSWMLDPEYPRRLPATSNIVKLQVSSPARQSARPPESRVSDPGCTTPCQQGPRAGCVTHRVREQKAASALFPIGGGSGAYSPDNPNGYARIFTEPQTSLAERAAAGPQAGDTSLQRAFLEHVRACVRACRQARGVWMCEWRACVAWLWLTTAVGLPLSCPPPP